MRRIREILRLKLDIGLSNRDTARAAGSSPASVCDMMQRAARAGLQSWPDAEALDEATLEALLYRRPTPILPPERPRPDPLWIHTERQSRKGITLELLHTEWLAAHPGGVQYTRFCDIYRAWLQRRRLSMRQLHTAGDKTFIDYSGQKAEVIDPTTGEVHEAEIFVAALGASNYTYAEATWTQQLPDFTASHVRAGEYFGGVTAAWVPDQLRSAVSGPHRYDPELNPTYHELGEHYGVTIIPARPRKPRDKAKVEVAVQVVQRWLLARLRKEQFFTLAALNQRIAELLTDLNNRPMRGYGNQSRRERYEQLDRPALRPLPTERYVFAEWRKAKVNIDYHLEVDHHYYSVPAALVGETLDVRLTADTVEVLNRRTRVALHRRSARIGAHTTIDEHMPAAHRAHAGWTPSRLINWAGTIGPATAELITDILHTRRHPEQGYRTCLGVLRLAKRYTPPRLEAACQRALAVGLRRVRQLEGILKAGLDRLPTDGMPAATSAPAIEHDNVRGPDYYH
ncbi:MAG: IS21 family transposase [Myxococcales bacterium]|nr:IS21 family transposase [Myxococcales bacterium]